MLQVGLIPGHVKHCITAPTRLQTTDGGKTVAVYTVSRELGHWSTSIVEAVYAHLGDVRQWGDMVEYRVEPCADILGEGLRALRRAFGITGGNTRLALQS